MRFSLIFGAKTHFCALRNFALFSTSMQQVVVAAAQPGIYTRDQSGNGLGVIVDGSDLVTANSPAKLGDTIVIYCNGLGEVAPAVPSGTAAPSTGPLSSTVNAVAVSSVGSTRVSISRA
jgi:uncharacterized protein (TIGR03437 family)